MKLVLLVLLALSYRAFGVPTPVINLHEGLIGLNDGIIEPQYGRPIIKDQAYTMEIYMGNVDQYDYMVDYCVANNIRFMDSYGCLRPDNVFRDFLETDQYTRPGALKRTLIYFYPKDVYLNIECVITVFHCRGCAERSCDSHPRIQYPNFTMPIKCNYPVSQPYALPPTLPYPIIPPAPPAPSPPLPYPIAPPIPIHQRCERCLWGLPWWLWLIFFIVLLILLCLVVFLCLCCLMRRKKKNQQSEVLPPYKEIYTIEKGVQADKSLESGGSTNGIHRRELDRHGSVRLIDQAPSTSSQSRSRGWLNIDKNHYDNGERQWERGEEQRRVDQMRRDQRRDQTARDKKREQLMREEISRGQTERGQRKSQNANGGAYDNHQFDIYEEDGIERVVTESRVFYENYPSTNPPTEISIEKNGDYYASRQPSTHRRLQQELQGNQRMQQLRSTSEEYREDVDVRNARGHQNLPVNYSSEALREETVRTMRQSSVI